MSAVALVPADMMGTGQPCEEPGEGDVETIREPQQVLRSAGLRVTSIRVATLEVVAATPHADAERIRAGVIERLGSVSVQSVYDTLNVLRTAGVLRKVEPAGHPARYEFHEHDNHHHLACRNCGAIEDVPCAVGSQPCMDPEDTHGFVVDEAEVIYWGLCPSCA